MKTIIHISSCSEGKIATDFNNLVVKLVDAKNALLAEYLFDQEKLTPVSTLYYMADISRVHFHYYNTLHEKIVIQPSEIKEIVCIN